MCMVVEWSHQRAMSSCQVELGVCAGVESVA
jgi:hypothetical protein